MDKIKRLSPFKLGHRWKTVDESGVAGNGAENLSPVHQSSLEHQSPAKGRQTATVNNNSNNVCLSWDINRNRRSKVNLHANYAQTSTLYKSLLLNNNTPINDDDLTIGDGSGVSDRKKTLQKFRKFYSSNNSYDLAMETTSKKRDNLSATQERLRKSADGTTHLTEEQRRAVKDAWHKANKKKGHAGQWIFVKLFAAHPHVKCFFNSETAIDGPLMDNPRFLKHAQMLSDVIEMAVDSTDALDDVLGPLLVSYGSQHATNQELGCRMALKCSMAGVPASVSSSSPSPNRPRVHRFDTEFFDLLADAMVEYAVQSWRQSDSTAESWRLLVQFIVSKLKQGFNIEKALISTQ